MTDTVISCEHLTHWYGKRKIYEDLSFEVKKGSFVGLLGKNGTGKTSLHLAERPVRTSEIFDVTDES